MSFPRRRESIFGRTFRWVRGWIPACAGMTELRIIQLIFIFSRWGIVRGRRAERSPPSFRAISFIDAQDKNHEAISASAGIAAKLPELEVFVKAAFGVEFSGDKTQPAIPISLAQQIGTKKNPGAIQHCFAGIGAAAFGMA